MSHVLNSRDLLAAWRLAALLLPCAAVAVNGGAQHNQSGVIKKEATAEDAHDDHDGGSGGGGGFSLGNQIISVPANVSNILFISCQIVKKLAVAA